MSVIKYGSIVLIWLVMGCSSFTSFQTADTVEEGKTEFTLSGSLIYATPEVRNVYEEGNQMLTQLMIRRGLTERREIQAIISPNSLHLYSKQLLTKGRKITTSFSTGIGYTFLASSFDDQLHVIDIPVSAFLTYQLSNLFEISLTPKIMYRYIGDESTFVFGSSCTLAMGRHIRLYPEAMIYYDPILGSLFTGGGIAVSF